MSGLRVTWDKHPVGELEKTGDEYSTEYRFRYVDEAVRRISVALPVRAEPYTAWESQAFFEALLPEGTLRETLAGQFRLPLNDSFGLLDRLGRDCAGALQIAGTIRMSEAPDVHWLDAEQIAQFIVDLPNRPLGMTPDGRMRLSLAGVQRKAVLVRDGAGRFGEPLHGMASTHLLKPEPVDGTYSGIATNEYFCMRLAAAVGLPVADVELLTIADRRCLVVSRFDRDTATLPARRLHQEDLCQAIGILPGFKYAAPDRPRPAFKDIAHVLIAHGSQPGRDRLTAGRMAVLNFLIGNADAHGKNVSFLHDDRERVRLAPLYDLVSTAAWSELDARLALSIGDEFDPAAITFVSFDDLAGDLGLAPKSFARDRVRFVARVEEAARDLLSLAKRDGWHHPILDGIVALVSARAPQVI
jgi:serine/threonine-protein kinase HipA